VNRAKKQKRPAAKSVRLAAPIVPRDTVSGRALLVVIAIMTFVASLTAGTLSIVHTVAIDWQSDLKREITIQVRPVDGRDQAGEVEKAVAAVRRVAGIADVRAVSREETGRLLEPWLGSGLDLSLLPIPRLIVVRLEENAKPNLEDLRRVLADEVAGATLDDHRGWSSRLATLSDIILLAGGAVLILVLIATTISVSLATRGAVAANRPIVEVLHLLGARDAYIANLFQRHFLAVGMKGGAAGGSAAAFLFALSGTIPRLFDWVSPGGGVPLPGGNLAFSWQGYAGIAAVAILVAGVTALASRLTVQRTLAAID
jgi:cell division transport system permease protein